MLQPDLQVKSLKSGNPSRKFLKCDRNRLAAPVGMMSEAHEAHPATDWGGVVPLVKSEDLWRAVHDLNVSDFTATALPPPVEPRRLLSV